MSRVECQTGRMSLRHAVLGLLEERPMSGYDLLKRFEQAMSNVWAATQSQLYGELGKLESAGLIRVHAEGPRGRKEYAITEAGQAELRHWLVEVEPTRVTRNEALLRVYFLGAVEPARAREYLERLNEAYARFFHEYDAAPLLIVNAATIDPISSQADYDELIATIRRVHRGRLYYNPLRHRAI